MCPTVPVRSIDPRVSHQCRIDPTMFLPTPNITIASSRMKRSGWVGKALTALVGQPYRNGMVSCPLKLYRGCGAASRCWTKVDTFRLGFAPLGIHDMSEFGVVRHMLPQV